MERPESVFSQRPDSALSVESNTRPFVQQEYTELPPPDEEPEQSPPPKKPRKKVDPVPLLPSQHKVADHQQSSLLAAGTFDEIDSHNSFLEALNAWRGAESSEVKPQSPRQKPVVIVRQYARESCWHCFKIAEGVNLVKMAGHSFCSDSCAGVYKAQNLVACSHRPACKKQFVKKDGIPRFDKWYCSDECLERHEHAQAQMVDEVDSDGEASDTQHEIDL